MSEALNSDSTNSASFLLLTFVAASGRPSQSQVAGLRHSDQFAHGGDGVIAFFAADELVALAHRRSLAKKVAGRVARGSLTPGLPQNRA